MDQLDPDDLQASPLKPPFSYHLSRAPSQLPISLVNASDIATNLLEADPDAFYRPVSTRTNLPDIFLEPEVHDSMAPKKKQPHLNGTATKPSSSSPSSLPRTTYRSVSNPVHAIPTPSSKPTSIPTRPGLIKERVKQFDQSSSRSTTSSPSTSRTPHSKSRDSTTPSRLKKPRGQTRQPLFGEVLSPDAGAGYGIPTLTKQRSNLETSLPKHLSPSQNGKFRCIKQFM
jgi:hypothetical protein